MSRKVATTKEKPEWVVGLSREDWDTDEEFDAKLLVFLGVVFVALFVLVSIIGGPMYR